MRWTWFGVSVLLMMATAHCKSRSDHTEGKTGPPGASPTPSGTITIRMGPDGKAKVEGAEALQGDPKDCAAFRACCSHPEMGLACGLIEAAGGSCAEALKSARAMLRERNLSPPAGCQ